MLFRIEDNKNVDGRHREYEIPFDCLPVLKIQELEKYIAEEVRKEINASQDRKLLSYSKLLGVCLLKYNGYADNELHINMDYLEGVYGGVYFCYKKDANLKLYEPFDLMNGLFGLKKQKYGKKIKLLNFNIDVSDNNLLDEYLKKMTGTGRKKVASPEKDKEILIMQAPKDIVISTYLESVYLLYALDFKYGMNKELHDDLIESIRSIDYNCFRDCGEYEREGLILIIEYLFEKGKREKKMIRQIMEDSKNDERLSMHYDPILQLHGIIDKYNFKDASNLGEFYNSNIASECIWICYGKYIEE